MTAPESVVCDVAPRQSLPSASRCLHCAQPLVDDAFAPFCCRGCRAVHGILRRAGLSRYYELRQGPGLPPVDLDSRRIDHKWSELLEEKRSSGIEYIVPQKRVELDSLGSTYLPVLAVLPASQMRPGLKAQLTISIEGRDDGKSSRLVEVPFVGPGS